jgi:hypothetical protein
MTNDTATSEENAMTMDQMETTRLRVEWWPEEEGKLAEIAVTRDEFDSTKVKIDTYADGQGSLSCYVMDRDTARRLALSLLQATEAVLSS